MRKTRILLLAVLFTLLLAPHAFASPEGDDAGSAPFSWDHLLSIGGATSATLLIVQYIKVPLDRLWKVPTRTVVYAIAFLLLFLATAFTTGITLEGFVMTLLNAVVVSTSAYGAYEVTFAKLKQ